MSTPLTSLLMHLLKILKLSEGEKRYIEQEVKRDDTFITLRLYRFLNKCTIELVSDEQPARNGWVRIYNLGVVQ